MSALTITIVTLAKICADAKTAYDILTAPELLGAEDLPIQNVLLSAFAADSLAILCLGILLAIARFAPDLLQRSLIVIVLLLLLSLAIGQISRSTEYPYAWGDPSYVSVLVSWSAKFFAPMASIWAWIYENRSWEFDGVFNGIGAILLSVVSYLFGKKSNHQLQCQSCRARDGDSRRY